MAIDQALHNAPKEWQEHQSLINKIAQAAAQGLDYGAQLKVNEIKEDKPFVSEYNSKLSVDVSLFNKQQKIKISTKEFSWSLVVEDLCITDSYVAIVLPKTVEVQEMRMKAKLVLRVDGIDYPVMYIGGNFEFNLIPGLPPLRILSFVRISGNISK